MKTQEAVNRVEEYVRRTLSPGTTMTGGCVTVTDSGQIIKGSLASEQIEGSRVIHYRYRNGEIMFELGQKN